MSNDFEFYVSQCFQKHNQLFFKNIYLFVLANLRCIWSRSSWLERGEIHYSNEKILWSPRGNPGYLFQKNKVEFVQIFCYNVFCSLWNPQCLPAAFLPQNFCLIKTSVVIFPGEGDHTTRAQSKLTQQIIFLLRAHPGCFPCCCETHR